MIGDAFTSTDGLIVGRAAADVRRAGVARPRRDRHQPDQPGQGRGDGRAWTLDGGRALLRLVEEPEKFLNPVLLTVNILQTVAASLSTVLFARLFGAIGGALAVVLNVIILFVFTEAVPKTWAVLHSEQAALATARPTSWLVRFWPLQGPHPGTDRLRQLDPARQGSQGGPFVSERELLGIVDAAAQDEVIEHEERELIESIIEFGDTVAREVMVPRPDMILVERDATVTAALDLAIAHGVLPPPARRAARTATTSSG